MNVLAYFKPEGYFEQLSDVIAKLFLGIIAVAQFARGQ